MTPPAPGPVTLRVPLEADAAAHARFPISREFVRLYGGDARVLPDPSLERSQRWLEWLRGQPFGRVIALNGDAVGEVRLHSVAVHDRKARLAIGLFSPDLVGRGIGRQAVCLALDHAFGPMGLHRVDLRVLAFNTRAIRCYSACGFVHEGTEREAACVEGAWHDDWIMGILARDHRARNGARTPAPIPPEGPR